MSLFDAEFVGGLRKDLRRVVKADPKLRQETRRFRPNKWTRHYDTSTLRFMLPVIFAGVAAILPHGNVVWYLLAGWAIGLATFRTGQFQRFYSACTQILCGQPILPEQILEEGCRRSFRPSLWLFVDALVVLAVTFRHGAESPAVWVGVVLAAGLIWASSLAISVILLGWRPRTSFDAFFGGAFTIACIGSVVIDQIGSVKYAILELLSVVVLRVTPPGWACQIGQWMLGTQPEFPALAAGLLVFWIALVVPGYRALQQHIWASESEEISAPPSNDSEPDDDAFADGIEHPREPAPEARASEVEEHILEGDFLRPYAGIPAVFHRWIERWIFSQFPRQSVLLDYLLAAPPGWSGMYRFGWQSLAIGAGLAWLASFEAFPLVYPVYGLAMVFAISCTTPLFGGSWPGLQVGMHGNRQIAFLALLPVAPRETTHLILKINARRYLLALPCWMVSFALLAWFMHDPLPPGALLGAGLWLTSLLLQPFFLVFKYSPGTNDSTSGLLNTLLFFVACMMPVAAAIAVIITLLSSAPLFSQAIAFTALAATSFGFERFYRWLYTSKRLDLVAKSAT